MSGENNKWSLTGKLGIGTCEPKEKLHIDSGDYTAGKLLISGTGKWDPSDPNPPLPPHQDQHYNFAEINLWDRVNDRLWHITHRNEPWASNQNKLIFYFGNKVLSGVSPPPTPWKSVMSLIPIMDDNGSVIGGNAGIGTDEVINNARLSVDGGAIVIGPSKSLFKKADAALQIFSSYGEFDRLFQMSPGISISSKPGLNLVASYDAVEKIERWWSWGVTDKGAWRITAGTEFDTNNPSGLTIISSGNVGIGTVNPQAGLEINKGNTNEIALILNSSGSGWGSGIQFKNTGSQGRTYGIYSSSLSGSLHIGDVDRQRDSIVINEEGHVGINTFFQVKEDARIDGNLITTSLRINGPLIFQAETTEIGQLLSDLPMQGAIIAMVKDSTIPPKYSLSLYFRDYQGKKFHANLNLITTEID